MDDLSAMYGWNERQTSCFALTRLEGVVKTWYDGLGTVQKSWSQWKTELKKAFPVAIRLQRRHQQMESRKRNKGEFIEQYFYKVQLARLCKLPDQQIVEYVITRLNDEALVRSLSVGTFDTLEALLECMKRLDDRLSIVRGNTKQPDRTVTTAEKHRSPESAQGEQSTAHKGSRRKPFKNSAGEPLCFSCNTYGHVSIDCMEPQKRERCDKCKRVGHNSSNCKDGAPSAIVKTITLKTDCAARMRSTSRKPPSTVKRQGHTLTWAASV